MLCPIAEQASSTAEFGGLVVLIQDWIDFDQIHADHAAVLMDHLHRKLRLAIANAARHRCAHAGASFGSSDIHVKADMDAIDIRATIRSPRP